MAKLWQDADGNTSSKRVIGLMAGIVGCFMGVITWICALRNPFAPFTAAIQLVGEAFATSAVLLGIGVCEKTITKCKEAYTSVKKAIKK